MASTDVTPVPDNNRPAETRGRMSRQEIYGRLEEGLEEIRRVGGLPSPLEAEDIWGNIWQQEAHNSTTIEGNTLILREVAVLLREGRAIGISTPFSTVMVGQDASSPTSF